MFGIRREVLEGGAVEPGGARGIEVTAEDVQRWRRTSSAGTRRLAVVGPFDDAERFEQLSTSAAAGVVAAVAARAAVT